MKYYYIEPVAEAELGINTLVNSKFIPRRISNAHAYLFNFPESDLIQAYPLFIVTEKLKNAMERLLITGSLFFECNAEKSEQYDDYSKNIGLPVLFCCEPCGVQDIDDIIYYTETEFKASSRFVELLKSMDHTGCVIRE